MAGKGRFPQGTKGYSSLACEVRQKTLPCSLDMSREVTTESQLTSKEVGGGSWKIGEIFINQWEQRKPGKSLDFGKEAKATHWRQESLIAEATRHPKTLTQHKNEQNPSHTPTCKMWNCITTKHITCENTSQSLLEQQKESALWEIVSKTWWGKLQSGRNNLKKAHLIKVITHNIKGLKDRQQVWGRPLSGKGACCANLLAWVQPL